MRPAPSHRLSCVAGVAAMTLFVTGCRLERTPLASWAQVQPMQYCAGDTLTASFDFLGSETCPADASCASYQPTIAISSTPTSFPPRSVGAFQHSFTFSPTGDSVSVLFDTDRDTVRVPTSRFDGSSRIFVDRTGITDTTRTARRATAPIPSTLAHGGDCTSGAPRYTPIEVPRLPRDSANVVLRRVVNVNPVPVLYVLNSFAGRPYEATLPPGGAIDVGMPGVPAEARFTTTIEAYPVGLVCMPGSGSTDPEPRAPPLSTQVLTGCP
jgi:hypothetical protein